MDLLITGWPCQGHSCARARHGLDDPRSNQFLELMHIKDWWFKHQSTPLGYILENVQPLGDTRSKVVEDGQYFCQILGSPMFLDAAGMGSYAYRHQ